jgi:hypothetical protein
MNVQRYRTATLPISLVLVLLVGFAPVVADGDQPEKKTERTEKSDKPDEKAKTEAPVSPIYRAAQEASAGKQDDAEAVVITNEDLERMMAGLTPEQKLQGVYQAKRHVGDPMPGEGGESQQTQAGQAPPAGQAPQGSLEWMKAQEDAAQSARVERTDAEKQVAELSAKVAELEKRLLALKNPLLPRRYAEKKDDEAQDWDEMNNYERVETTQQELDKAKAELAEAQAKLRKSR